MDIVSRLKSFLDKNGISNSQFADTCDIPRPTLSQLLNGRNKKVSDELITKIHRAYPRLSIMWLMFGDGDMFVPNENNEDLFSQAEPFVNSMQQNSLGTGYDFRNSQSSINFDSSDGNSIGSSAQRREQSQPRRTSALSDALEDIARTMTMGRNIPVNASTQTEGRRIASIMVFYTDNSFETFTPGH